MLHDFGFIVIQIHVQLRGIFMTEAVYFQFHYYMAFQNAVVEYKVSEAIVLVYQYAFLTGFEAEAVSHFKQEILQVVKYRLLQIVFSNQRPVIDPIS